MIRTHRPAGTAVPCPLLVFSAGARTRGTTDVGVLRSFDVTLPTRF